MQLNPASFFNTVGVSRRQALRNLGLGALGLSALGALTPKTARADLNQDLDILTFALNLEYLEAQYYTYGTTGRGLPAAGVQINGTGQQGFVTIKPNPKVPFSTPEIEQYATEIAKDEQDHVTFLRAVLSQALGQPIAQPAIDLVNSFNQIGRALGYDSFDPFESEKKFLLGAFIFEDVGVTAYKSAARLISNKDYLEAAAGILAVEAYHAGNVRVNLFSFGEAYRAYTRQLSDARQELSGAEDDQPVVGPDGKANIVPADANGIVYSRTARQILNILYGARDASQGLFFPNGVNLRS